MTVIGRTSKKKSDIDWLTSSSDTFAAKFCRGFVVAEVFTVIIQTSLTREMALDSSDGENLSDHEIVLVQSKSLKNIAIYDVQRQLQPSTGSVKSSQATLNHPSTSHTAHNITLSRAVLDEARIAREKMNKRINACQVDFSYPPIFCTAEVSSDLNFNRRPDYATIFSQEDLEHLGIAAKQSRGLSHPPVHTDSRQPATQRQPSCLLDKPLPPSRFSESDKAEKSGRICVSTAPPLIDLLGSFNRLCCAGVRTNGPSDYDSVIAPSKSGLDSDLDRRLRLWGNGFVPTAQSHGELDGISRPVKSECLHRRTPSSLSSASTPPAGMRNSRRAEELFAAAAPVPVVRSAAPNIADFVSDDAAAAAASAAAAAAEIPDYNAEYSDDGYYESGDEDESGDHDVWGEGYGAPSARGASPRIHETVVENRCSSGGSGSRYTNRRQPRGGGDADAAVSYMPCIVLRAVRFSDSYE